MTIDKRLKYYKNEIWFLDEKNIWTNANLLWDDKTVLRRILGKKIKAWHIALGLAPLLDSAKSTTTKSVELTNTGYFMWYMTMAWETPIRDIDTNILVSFSNGWIDLKMIFHKDEFPFNTSQINFEYKPSAPVMAEVDEYLNWMSGNDENRKKAMLAGFASTLMRRNDALLMLLYSKLGGTGKTQLGSIFKKIASTSILRIKTENVFGKSAEGNKFAITGIKNKTGIIGEELPTNLNQAATDLIKDLIDEGKAEIATEDKGKNAEETDNIVTMVISTNRISNWYDVDNALKTRVSIIQVQSDLDHIPHVAYTANFKEKIYNNIDSLQYVLSLAVNYYIEAKKGWRSEGFKFGITDSNDYWKQVDTADSIILDFAEYGLDDFLEKREDDFITNGMMEKWYTQWKAKNYSSSVTLLAMKKKVAKYIETNTAFTANVGSIKKIDKKSVRGILILGVVPWEEIVE